MSRIESKKFESLNRIKIELDRTCAVDSPHLVRQRAAQRPFDVSLPLALEVLALLVLGLPRVFVAGLGLGARVMVIVQGLRYAGLACPLIRPDVPLFPRSVLLQLPANANPEAPSARAARAAAAKTRRCKGWTDWSAGFWPPRIASFANPLLRCLSLFSMLNSFLSSTPLVIAVAFLSLCDPSHRVQDRRRTRQRTSKGRGSLASAAEDSRRELREIIQPLLSDCACVLCAKRTPRPFPPAAPASPRDAA